MRELATDQRMQHELLMFAEHHGLIDLEARISEHTARVIDHFDAEDGLVSFATLNNLREPPSLRTAYAVHRIRLTQGLRKAERDFLIRRIVREIFERAYNGEEE